jgi:hypothetical protein
MLIEYISYEFHILAEFNTFNWCHPIFLNCVSCWLIKPRTVQEKLPELPSPSRFELLISMNWIDRTLNFSLWSSKQDFVFSFILPTYFNNHYWTFDLISIILAQLLTFDCVIRLSAIETTSGTWVRRDGYLGPVLKKTVFLLSDCDSFLFRDML